MEKNKNRAEIINFIENIAKKKLTKNELEQLINAIMSPSELQAMTQRLHVIQLLNSNLAQREIAEKLKVGIATVTRGNRIYKDNQKLFSKILERN